MKMKKRIGILLLVSVLCLLSSCYAYKSLEMEYEKPSSINRPVVSEITPVSVHKIDNETPYQKLITKEIDIHEFAQKYWSVLDGSLCSSDIHEVSVDIGIECLREAEKGVLYSVHKVKQGGLLYIFYDNLTEMEDTSTLCYHNTVCSFYVQKKLSSDDFASIKEGSTITDIKKIDPTAQIWENLYNADPDSKYYDESSFYSLHYLNDGILWFILTKTEGEIKVYNQDLITDFQMYMSDGLGLTYYSCKVLDQDLLW